MAVVAINVLLVAINVGGLRLAGLGIDLVRHQIDPSGAKPTWPLGIAPPQNWSAMQTLVAISEAILVFALAIASTKFVAAVAAAGLS